LRFGRLLVKQRLMTQSMAIEKATFDLTVSKSLIQQTQ
jgi:hypothetical protein